MTGKREWTQAELCAEARARFGEDHWAWAFTCPNCGETATAADFKAAEASPQRVGQECIGRHLGALAKEARGTDGQAYATRGCDWAAFGLFPGPWFITTPEGKQLPSFPLAPAE